MAIKLDPHQIKAVNELSSGKVLKGDVGVGKSRIALAYYFIKECRGGLKINGKGDWKAMKTPKDLYIFTTVKKRDNLDWFSEGAPFALTSDPKSSFGGVKVTVDSWNNIHKYTDIKDAFIIFDEQRLVGSGVWVKSFLKMAKYNNWIMLSATPGDSWIEYVPLFIANGFYKNRKDFIEQHVVYRPFVKFPQIDHYVHTKKLEYLRDSVLVDVSYARHTVRHVFYQNVEYDQAKYKELNKNLWNPYLEKPIESSAELYYLRRRIVNSDPSRLEEIRKIHQKFPKLIIFYNFDYELELLRGLVKELDVEVGEWNGHRHQEIPKAKRWIYLVQYTAGNEGWNCVETNAILYYSLNYSYKVNMQSRGRIDRMNTKFVDLYYFILRSTASIDREILNALRQKKNFNEKRIEIPKRKL